MKTEILNQFDKHTRELLQLLASLSEKQLNEVPFENSWTAGQLGDHLYKSYAVVEILNGRLRKNERPPDEKLEEGRKLFLDFTLKMDSPEEILPSKEPIKKETLLNLLEERIAAQREVILHKDLNLICLDFEIPEYGLFSRLEWIGFNTVHTQRHVHQLKGIISRLKASNAKG